MGVQAEAKAAKKLADAINQERRTIPGRLNAVHLLAYTNQTLRLLATVAFALIL